MDSKIKVCGKDLIPVLILQLFSKIKLFFFTPLPLSIRLHHFYSLISFSIRLRHFLCAFITFYAPYHFISAFITYYPPYPFLSAFITFYPRSIHFKKLGISGGLLDLTGVRLHDPFQIKALLLSICLYITFYSPSSISICLHYLLSTFITFYPPTSLSFRLLHFLSTL